MKYLKAGQFANRSLDLPSPVSSSHGLWAWDAPVGRGSIDVVGGPSPQADARLTQSWWAQRRG